MTLLELKNILKNIKISGVDKFIDELTRTGFTLSRSILNYPGIHKEISEKIDNIKNEEGLYRMKEGLYYDMHEWNKEAVKKLKERERVGANFGTVYFNYSMIMKKINKKLGLNEYDGIDKEAYHKSILNISHPEEIFGYGVEAHKKRFLKPGSRENELYNEFKNNILKNIDDINILSEIKKNYENYLNKEVPEEHKGKVREIYEEYILPHIEKRKQELIPKYKERMTKVIESMHPEKEQKSPTQRILEKLKIK